LCSLLPIAHFLHSERRILSQGRPLERVVAMRFFAYLCQYHHASDRERPRPCSFPCFSIHDAAGSICHFAFLRAARGTGSRSRMFSFSSVVIHFDNWDLVSRARLRFYSGKHSTRYIASSLTCHNTSACVPLEAYTSHNEIQGMRIAM